MASRWYGNVINRLMETQADPPEITVGMGATEYLWSDRQPYEVTRIKDQKHLWIRGLGHKCIEGYNGYDNMWELYSDENRSEIYVVKRGKYWYTEGAYDGVDGVRHKCYNRINITFGKADYYYDPSF